MKHLLLALILAATAFGQSDQPLTATSDAVTVYAFNNHDLAPIFANLHIGQFQPAVFFILTTTDNSVEAYRITVFYDDDDGRPQTRSMTVDRTRATAAGTSDPPTYANLTVSAAQHLRFTVMPMGQRGASLQSN
ncbi:MAG: hypothetical protein M3O35_00610 [Acidobacteriota bacterium]|nr:hypothetical protein [Acidobacteriota bacterium]